MSYGEKVTKMTQQQREILCDAQTTGGLLVIVEKSAQNTFLEVAQRYDLKLEAIGETVAQGEKSVEVV